MGSRGSSSGGMPPSGKEQAIQAINARIASLGKERYEERRAKLVRQRVLLENNNVYSAMPKGWKVIDGATTAPKGYTWISNGKSAFGGNRKIALVPTSATKNN